MIDLNTKNHEYYHLRAMICFDMNKFEDALMASNKSIELCLNNHGYYAHRARINNELGNYNEALKDIECALSMEQNNSFYKELKNSLLKKLELS